MGDGCSLGKILILTFNGKFHALESLSSDKQEQARHEVMIFAMPRKQDFPLNTVFVSSSGGLVQSCPF